MNGIHEVTGSIFKRFDRYALQAFSQTVSSRRAAVTRFADNWSGHL
jgi:hypothetical protein